MEVSDKDIPYNFGDWYGIHQFGGYVASLPVNLLRLPWHTPRAKQIFGVNYTVKRDPPAPNQQEVFQGASGLKVYWNTRRVSARVDGSRGSADQRRRRVTGHHGRRLVGSAAQDLYVGGTAAAGNVLGRTQLAHPAATAGVLPFEAEMGCRGMVDLGRQLFPGLGGRVDGKRAPDLRSLRGLRGVVVDEGKHRIEMRYSAGLGDGRAAADLSGIGARLSSRSVRRKTEAGQGLMRGAGVPLPCPKYMPRCKPRSRRLWRRMFAFAGPAYLVSVGYMDPGNWATDLEGGARFGYQLLWVLVMSNLMAILLQTLSARLGIVRGWTWRRPAARPTRRRMNYVLWFLCEIAIAACDLAEVLGAAIGLNLLFHIPLLTGVLLTAADTLLVLWLSRIRHPGAGGLRALA